MSLPDEPTAKPSLRWAYAAMAFNLVAWGMSWVNVRAIVHVVGAGELGALRYLIASTVMLGVWFFRGRPLPAGRDLPLIALLGAFGFTLYNLGINFGERTVDAGTGSMLISCVPVLVVLYGVVTRQEKVTAYAWLGILTSMVGVAFTSGVLENGVTLNAGTALIFGAALCAAAQTLLSKHLTRRYAPIDVTTWAIWFGTLGLLPFAHDLGGATSRLGPAGWGHLLFLGIVPAALCYTLWAWVLQRLPLTTVMGSVYVIPLFSVVFSWAILGERPPAEALTGGLLTLAGVAIVQRLGRARAAA
jgi:drug/metabolite transporter (DMT)-like permease